MDILLLYIKKHKYFNIKLLRLNYKRGVAY